jgi:hypothetical protein
MAFTLGALTEIDDTAVDAESPITESLMTSLRDNAYWIVAGTTQTTETTTGKLLETTGGAGDMQWTAKTTIAVDKTKGSGTMGTTSGAPTQIAEVSGKALLITVTALNTNLTLSMIIDQSDLTYSNVYGSGTYGSQSGTLTGSFVSMMGAVAIYARATGGNIELYENLTSSAYYSYIWL